jgi:hypothetical protein
MPSKRHAPGYIRHTNTPSPSFIHAAPTLPPDKRALHAISPRNPKRSTCVPAAPGFGFVTSTAAVSRDLAISTFPRGRRDVDVCNLPWAQKNYRRTVMGRVIFCALTARQRDKYLRNKPVWCTVLVVSQKPVLERTAIGIRCLCTKITHIVSRYTARRELVLAGLKGACVQHKVGSKSLEAPISISWLTPPL